MFKSLPVLLTLFTLTTATLVGYADTMTYGPVTLGSNAPFGEPGYFPETFQDGSPYGVVSAVFPGVGLSDSTGTGVFASGSLSFVYDLAPGWQADTILYDNIDFGTLLPPEDYAVAFFQEIILCPSSSPGDCTTGSIVHAQYGNASFLPSIGLTPNATAAPGTGIYEYAEYVYHDDFNTQGGITGINVFLTPPADTPEPSTLILMGTGLIGFAGAVRRKYFKQ